MARRSKVIFCLLLAFLYVVVNICPLRAEALPDVMSGSTTLADNIMTYYALSGSAVANSDWINTLYSSYGSSFGTIEELAEQGYLVLNDAGMWEPVQQLGEMIEQAPAYSSLGLNEVFNISAEEAAQGGGLAAASGGSILAGSLGCVGSTGVLPLLGGVTASYWGGIALGTLIAHKLGLYDEQIVKGVPIDTATEVMSDIPVGSPYAYVKYYISSSRRTVYVVLKSNSTCSIGYPSDSGTSYIYGIWNNTENTETVYSISYDNNLVATTNTLNNARKSLVSASFQLANVPYFIDVDYKFNSLNDYKAQRSKWINGTETPQRKNKYSPDMIGENGNLTGSQDGNQYTVPDMKPQIDPGQQAGKPLTLQDWQNFANSVSNNNNQTSPTDLNKTLFDNILDAIRVANPNANPNPNPNPDPYSPPVVTPVPDPSYPDPVPDQQITENPQESENPQQTEPLDPNDTGKPWKLPDLRQKFPFCIPWDIAKIFSKLKVNSRQAPHISWRFNPPNTPIDYTFNLDLEDFEAVASLLRTLELMGFIVGLAFVTRYLIGTN